MAITKNKCKHKEAFKYEVRTEVTMDDVTAKEVTITLRTYRCPECGQLISL